MPPKRVRRPAQLAPQASHELFPIIDHVVILVPDLEAAIQSYSTQLGFRVIPGGKHAGMPGQRTWNALIPFEADGTYIELIAFMPKHVEDEENRKEGKELAPAPGANKPEKDHRWWGLAPGLIDYALLPKDIDSAISTLAKLPGNPIQYAGPAPGARKTPSGRMLEWKMGYPPSLCPARNDADADRPLPFFCYDVTPRGGSSPCFRSPRSLNHNSTSKQNGAFLSKRVRTKADTQTASLAWAASRSSPGSPNPPPFRMK